MQELLNHAVSGWYRYTDDGKYAVLFLAMLLYLWFVEWAGKVALGAGKVALGGGKAVLGAGKNPVSAGQGGVKAGSQKKQRSLLLQYATVTAVFAIFPVTAVALMKYQTSFFDYEWIWSAVPVTAVTAWGITDFYLGYYRAKWRGKRVLPAGYLAACLAVIFLCGNLGTGISERRMTPEGEKKAAAVLDKLEQNGDAGDICLWAPREILQYARGVDGEIRLLYGRNMWENALNAYAYDTYDDQTIALYEWMEQLALGAAEADGPDAAEVDSSVAVEAAGPGAAETARPGAAEAASPGAAKDSESTAGKSAVTSADTSLHYLQTAIDHGVNCIIVPENCGPALAAAVMQAAGERNLTVQEWIAGGYHFYRLLG